MRALRIPYSNRMPVTEKDHDSRAKKIYIRMSQEVRDLTFKSLRVCYVVPVHPGKEVSLGKNDGFVKAAG
jgi:hypothetical protein